MMNTTDKFYNDLYFMNENEKQKDIANKYGYTEGYASQVINKFSMLKTKPIVKDSKLVCHYCNNPNNLTFYQNEYTGEYLYLICKKCAKIRRKDKILAENDTIFDDEKVENLMRLLKSLHKFMVDKMQPMEGKNLTQKDINLIQEIEEIIK